MPDPSVARLLESAPEGVVVTDSAGRVRLANAQLAEMFGYAVDELQGVDIETLIPEAQRASHRISRQRYIATPRRCVMAPGTELLGCRKDASEFPIEVSLGPMETASGHFVIACVRDISEQRRQSHRLRSQIEEQQLLLHEVHHRARNDMQLISSLLGLQKQTLSDPQAVAALSKSQDQVRALTLVHDLLWTEGARSSVNLQAYIERLVDEIRRAHAAAPVETDIHVQCDPAEVSFNAALRLGLALNELVANSLKHAFPEEAPGTITVLLRVNPDENGLELTVSDTGVGLPADVDSRIRNRTGLQLVGSLVAHVRGSLQVMGPPGTTFVIRLARDV